MTRIDFYVLKQANDMQQALLFACRLVHKAFGQGHSLYIHTTEQGLADSLDAMLWAHPGDGFLPHALLANGEEKINIGCATDSAYQPGNHADIMLNLAPVVPGFFSRFSRVIELVPGDAREAEIRREHYSYYKERGFALQSHTIG